MLGLFIGICNQRVGTAGEIMSQADIVELRDILDYANKFHDDTNPAYETKAINDRNWRISAIVHSGSPSAIRSAPSSEKRRGVESESAWRTASGRFEHRTNESS